MQVLYIVDFLLIIKVICLILFFLALILNISLMNKFILTFNNIFIAFTYAH